MSFKQKLISTATLVFALAAFATFASAQDTTSSTTAPPDSATTNMKPARQGYGRGKFGREGRGGDHGDKMMVGELSRLNLTDAQKTQIKSVMEANRPANQGTHEEMRGLMMKKRDGSITADEQTKLDGLKEQQKASGKQVKSSIMAILTPEQRTQLDQFKAERKQQMMQHKQMRQNQQPAPPAAPNN